MPNRIESQHSLQAQNAKKPTRIYAVVGFAAPEHTVLLTLPTA